MSEWELKIEVKIVFNSSVSVRACDVYISSKGISGF